MGEKHNSQEKFNNHQKKSFLRSLFTKEEKDETYFPELKEQWQKMDRKERLKFLLGAIFGLILFISALVLVFLIINAMKK